MTPHEQLDLFYPDPPAPLDLATRAIGAGRARRRRRRAATATAAAACALSLIAIAAPRIIESRPTGTVAVEVPTSPVDQGGPVDLSSLPIGSGEGPTAAELVAPGAVLGELLPETRSAQARGDVHVVGEVPHGPQLVVWITNGADFCTGMLADAATEIRPRPSWCSPLHGLPAEGLWSSPPFPTDSETSPVMVTGIVQGDASKVVVSAPSGDVTATVFPTGVPGLGSVYAAIVPLGASSEATIRRTAYRGSDPVFSCTGDDCMTFMRPVQKCDVPRDPRLPVACTSATSSPPDGRNSLPPSPTAGQP